MRATLARKRNWVGAAWTIRPGRIPSTPMAPFAHLDRSDYALAPELQAQLLSPSLVVFLDQVRANIRRVIECAGGKPDRWRVHLKTTKIPAVWDELLSAGVRHFKCATVREAAELLALLDERGITGDVLLAYPLVGPGLEYLGRLAVAHGSQRVSVLCEDEERIGSIPTELEIFIDLNSGMDRTGVPVADRETILACARAAQGRLAGLHHYDGHLHDADLDLRRQEIFEGYDRLVALVGYLKTQGVEVDEVITAGTPAFLSALEYAPLRELEGARHRVSPGTVVFHDARSQVENPGLGLAPAAFVFSRVVSQPCRGQITLDAGSKALAAEAGDPAAHALGHPEWTALSPSEEHLPVDLGNGPAPERGSTCLLIPRHVCPTVNLAEQALLVESDGSHSVVRVSARAHDLFAPG
ncbi:MAG TPA: D-TA family PLP-dependent enzyme [Planctomycetes bacterium]|nr:D-TA family PLP-dependent enzyme [Planctomycetota bacterium]HIK61803.1 D-TA family PLP-dependent enzyme [Planctomycetota bacterium]